MEEENNGYSDFEDSDGGFDFNIMEIDLENCSGSSSSDNESIGVSPRKRKRISAIEYSSDSESEVESETEISNNSDSDENWVDIDENSEDNLPQEIPFSTGHKSVGSQIQRDNLEPIDFFKIFFTDELISKIAEQTNTYAKNKINGKNLKKNSIWHNWTDISIEEMNAFLGLILNMGTIPLKNMKEYFSLHFINMIPFFPTIFKRERFFQIFWMFHLNENLLQNNSLRTRTQKVNSYIEYLDSKFRENFVPEKEICVGESVVKFKGKIAFITYNPNKPTKWGLQIYVLADANTGYVYSILPYYGTITTDSLIHPELPMSTRIVLHLYNNLLQSIPGATGYHLYTDRYYTSIPLAEKLLKKKCYLTGTIKSNRKFLPAKIAKPNLKIKNVVACRSKNLLALAWKDKRVVTMLSSYGSSTMKIITRIKRGGIPNEIKKPRVVCDYNKYMEGVDRADQYAATYCFMRKSIKWWRKLFFWGLEICSINSYILYKTHCKRDNIKPIKHSNFIRELVESLVGNFRQGAKCRGRPSTSEHENRLDDKLHILMADPQGKHNDCLVCSNRKIKGGRRTTVYFCETCDRKPFLHVGHCFKKYHTLKKYK